MKFFDHRKRKVGGLLPGIGQESVARLHAVDLQSRDRCELWTVISVCVQCRRHGKHLILLENLSTMLSCVRILHRRISKLKLSVRII